MALSSAGSELHPAAVKTASEGLGIQSVAKDLGISCVLNLHLDASATRCVVNRRGLGKAKHVDMQNLWIQEASKSCGFTTRKVGTKMNPADLMDETAGKSRRLSSSWALWATNPWVMWTRRRVDRQERDDVFAAWRSKRSGTLVASSVTRDSSSGDDVVHDCSGEVCGDVVKDEGG